MLGAADTARLYARIREKEGLSYGVGSRLSASPLDESGEFTAFAIYAPQNAARVEAAFREEMARVLEKGFDAEEIAQAKSGWRQSRQMARAQDASLARTLAAELYLQRTLAWDAGVREEGRGADRAGHPRRDAPVSRPGEADDREGRRLRQGGPVSPPRR